MVILVITEILVVAAMLILIHGAYEKYRPENVRGISFKQAFDLTALPIVTFTMGGKKYNFLLDTGSTYSHINKKVVETSGIDYTVMNATKHVFGMEGNQVEVSMVRIDLTLNGKVFRDNFLVNDLDAAFDVMKRWNGADLSGILGTSFLEKYKYVIDFQKCIAYPRK